MNGQRQNRTIYLSNIMLALAAFGSCSLVFSRDKITPIKGGVILTLTVLCLIGSKNDKKINF